ncbi:cytosolic carboxypeptidase 2-like [Ischnura elegans]|uniref:cytosolic carboxypeptidase 2-like n=1 Tax=Ischnura elegans TaxID=197161 RepID=UPI001ED874DA|nr:cytosolic carboxypeptidase 2-like [Ischnura elegans]
MEQANFDEPLATNIVKAGSYLSSFLQNTLKSNQVEIDTDARTNRTIARLKEPRELFSLSRDIYPQQGVRWPIECQVIEERIYHIDYIPPTPEQYYVVTGRELKPKPVGVESGTVIYDYRPCTSVNYESPNVTLPLQFSRSLIGGTPATPEMVAATPYDEIPGHTLHFESRFECGNLAKVVKITDVYYELYLRPDLYTGRHMQWFYFRVQDTRSHCMYRFSIVNLSKPDSLYSCGMKPLMYSTKDADLKRIGWRRCGENISYFRNNSLDEDDLPPSYTLTFNIEFPYDGDTVFLAHSYPYTYSALQDYLIKLQNDPVKSEFSKLRLLCRTLAGNNVYYLTITAPTPPEESKKKQAVVVTARVHPGETPSSWMMKGFLDYLTSDSNQAKELREKFIFKLVPMLNPDGVIVGNNRCSLTGRDLNRQYRTVIRETYPSIWYTKVMIRRLLDDCGIVMYCDLHAHSRKHNVFIYGCESKRVAERTLKEQVFPLMLHKNAADKFSFENCKFRIQRNKEGTGRVVLWSMGVNNSYTMEASFGGSRLAGRRYGTHFSTADLEAMGRHFCDTLLDFCDEDPSKERLRNKIVTRLLEEGSNADEPTNIILSDYSSDDGDTSSSSEDEKENMVKLDAQDDTQEDTQSSPISSHHRLMPEKKSTVPKLVRRQSSESVSAWYNQGRTGIVASGNAAQRPTLSVTQATLEPPADSNASVAAVEEGSGEQPESLPNINRGSSNPSGAGSQGNHHPLLWARKMAARGSEGQLRPTPNSCVTAITKGLKDGQTKQIRMPPELIVTQAQVYEGQLSIDLIETVEIKEIKSEESSKLPQNLLVPGSKISEDRPRITRSLSQRGQLASRSFSEPKNRFPNGRAQSISSNEMSVESSARYSFLWQKLWPGSGLPPSCRPFVERRESQPVSLSRKASLIGRNEESKAKKGSKELQAPASAKPLKSKSKKPVSNKDWDVPTAVEEGDDEDDDSDLDDPDESYRQKKTRRQKHKRKLWRVGFQKKNKDDSALGKVVRAVKSSPMRKDEQPVALSKPSRQKIDRPKTPKPGGVSYDPPKKLTSRSLSLVPVMNDQWKTKVKFKAGGLAVTAVQCGFAGDGVVADESELGEDEEVVGLERTDREDTVAGEHKRKKRRKKKKRKAGSIKSSKKISEITEAEK